MKDKYRLLAEEWFGTDEPTAEQIKFCRREVDFINYNRNKLPGTDFRSLRHTIMRVSVIIMLLALLIYMN